VSVPCDTPNFPLDLVQRLADALAQDDADIAMAATIENGQQQVQPVFCLLKSTLMESLVEFLHDGQRKIDLWTARHRSVAVAFDDSDAFFNANTLAELQSLARPR
jgi:molybdopterin-guanine dinucleotide biosynthesis protein A